MKGRSYRFSSTEPHEDWVDGSWTVDCVCGVNFDDGEEMVNCDECGVWVHTRCSRYVKGDELFTCDKCKSKNSINDSEETEVAQLLVELPTKTLRMETSYPQSIPLRRPFRLWTEIPMEERVHVQGVPGGDPALFEGLSSVFSRELWKSTGYVPKKFSIKYREFPYWDEKEKNERENACENGHQAENGAGVLFSMSKENVVAAPTSTLVGTRDLDDKEANLKLSMKDNKRWNSSEVDPKRSETGLKKENSLLRPVITNKRKKEELGASRDRIKKKVQVTDREADEKKGLVRKAASRSTSECKPLDSRKDRDSHAFNGDAGNVKSEKSKETNEESFDSGLAVHNGGDVTSDIAIPVECSKGTLHSDGRAHGTRNQDDKAGHHVRIVLKSSANIDSPFQERIDAINNQAKEERHSTTADNSEDNAEVSNGISVKPSIGHADGAALEVEEKRFDDINGDISISTGKNELLKQLDDASTGGAVGQQALEPVDSKGAGTCAAGTSNIKIMASSNSDADDHKMQSFDRASDRASTDNVDKSDELSGHPSQVKRELLPSEGSVSTQKDTTESKPEPGLLQEPSKKSSRPFPAYSKPKVVVCIGKSSTSEAAMPKSYSFDNLKHTASQNSIPDAKQEPNDGHANGASIDLVKEKDRDDVSRKALKEHPKYSTSSRSIPQGRISHSSFSKRSMLESASASLSSKASSAPPTTDSAETAGSLQNQYALQLQNKQSSSGIPQKSEKHSQPICHSSTKSPGSLAPNPSATLSDEELALLLHQELNSSPRVPRVPRMRQPGSLPQLASPAATSLLIKRTSSSGSKDHVSASRKKNKDASKDGFRSSRDIDDNRGTKSYKVRYPPDWKSHDSGNRGSMCAKGEENEPAKTLHSSRKVLPPSSTTSTSSGPCSSNEVNDHSIPSPHSSPRNTSDDAPMHQTLPGLINEIMSKGKRMTYEELCNAVLPHWPHLRKHNGERYAYSSHSQAVLDCLRNRHEWARLVDRGPKTNSTRKKRKTDAEESDENESNKGQDRDECGAKQREDFPKGKRKARKRRRLALQGKDIKDLRKKRKEEMSEEDEEGPFSDSDSDSSNESISSEDDEGEEEASLSSASEEETARATPS